MRAWICRLLSVVFLLNCMTPYGVAQSSRRASKHKRSVMAGQTRLEQTLEDVVNNTQRYESWKIEKVELENVLKGTDLTDLEREFAELELKQVETNIAFVDELGKDKKTISEVNRIYGAKLDRLNKQAQALEKFSALRNFYQKAQSSSLIAASVYAMHKQAAEMVSLFKSDAPTMDQLCSQGQERLICRNDAIPSDQNLLPVRREPIIRSSEPSTEVLSLWAENKLSLEELVEFADPVREEVSAENVADASEILFAIFYGYNNAKEQPIQADALENALWLAKHLKYRADHQLYELQRKTQSSSGEAMNWLRARGNLMLLMIQINNFLNQYNQSADEAAFAAEDRKLEEYAAVKETLASYRPGTGAYSNVTVSITNEIKEMLDNHPSADSVDSIQLATNLSYVVRYLIFTGHVDLVADLIARVNNDKETFHGENEKFVGAIFTSIFDSMINDELSVKRQKVIRQLLWCAAAPVCNYNTTKKTNAVNVRTQALAVASMLRQLAKDGKLQAEFGKEIPLDVKILDASLFNDESFRTAMAAYTVDIYAPTNRWNVVNNEVVRYGLSLDELSKFSNYLANIYETFLPVRVPTTQVKTLSGGGSFDGCWVREVDVKHLTELQSLSRTKGGIVKPSHSTSGVPCAKNRHTANALYNVAANEVVLNSAGYAKVITALNPYNREAAIADFTKNIIFEISTWYLWGVAWKGVSYGWKGIRALAIAGKASAKVNNGVRMARFQSKFAQVWKYSTNGWKTEMGLVNVTKQGEKILVEMHRPGYQGYMFEFSKEVLQGHSLKTLKGRILLRRALQRRVYAQYGAVPGAAGVTTEATAKTTQLALRTTSNDLADNIVRPLTKAEQETVRQEHTVVDAVKHELQEGTSFEVIPAKKGEPVFLYRPTKAPEGHINLSTGLPEQVVLDPATGNVMGQFSHQYAGTVVTPYLQNQVAYNIASGLTYAPSSQFMRRVLTNEFPVFSQLNGLTKFVLTLTALDQPAYYLYTQPYMEKFAKEQDEALVKETGLKDESEDAPQPKNMLEQIQSIQPKSDSAAGASMLGAFFGVNQLLHYILPDWLTEVRQSFFKNTVQVTQAVDQPLSDALSQSVGNAKLNDLFPLPGQVLSLPFVLAGDPTPTYSEATRAQYQLAAGRQRVERAIKKHNVTQFQQSLDKILEDIETLPGLLQKVYAHYLDEATTQELQKAVEEYKQAAREARTLAETDLEKADKKFAEADQSFSDKQGRLLAARVEVVTKADVNALVEQYRQMFRGYGEAIFDAAADEQLTRLAQNYAKEFIAQYSRQLQAASIARQTGQKVEDIQEQTTKAMDRNETHFKNKLDLLALTLQVKSSIEQTDEFVEGIIQLNQVYLSEEDMVQLKRYGQVYKQNLKNQLASQPKNATKLGKQISREDAKFHNSYLDLLSKRITAFFDNESDMSTLLQQQRLKVSFGLVLQDADLQESARLSKQLTEVEKQKALSLAGLYQTAAQTGQPITEVYLKILEDSETRAMATEQALQALKQRLYDKMVDLLRLPMTGEEDKAQVQQILLSLKEYDTLPLRSGMMSPYVNAADSGLDENTFTELKQKRNALIEYYTNTVDGLFARGASGEELYRGYQEASKQLKESWQKALKEANPSSVEFPVLLDKTVL